MRRSTSFLLSSWALASVLALTMLVGGAAADSRAAAPGPAAGAPGVVAAASGTLCVTKFNDLNGDGSKGATEPTLSGWVFTIRALGGAVVGTITTTSATRTCTDVPAATLTVSETQQAGWTPTVPAGGSQTVMITAGHTTTVTFGNRQAQTGTLCVTKFNDLNGDGVQGATEPTLSGWAFTISAHNGAIVGTITTSGATRTCTDVPAGTYSVSETLQAGWTPTVPAGGSQIVTITAGQTVPVAFGNRQTTSGALILAASSPFMNNNAINWGEYVDLMTTGPVGTVFSMQVTTDNVTWETLTDGSKTPPVPWSFTIGSGGTSTFRYTPIRNYWYRSVAGSMTSNSPRVTVRQTIALRPTHTGTQTIGRGTMIAFMANVRPARPELAKADVVFELWQKSSGGWVRIRTATEMIDSSGVADWTWTASSPGSFFVRAQVLPTPVNANSFWSPNQYYAVK